MKIRESTGKSTKIYETEHMWNCVKICENRMKSTMEMCETLRKPQEIHETMRKSMKIRLNMWKPQEILGNKLK